MGNIDFQINEFGEIKRGTNDSEIFTLAHQYYKSAQQGYNWGQGNLGWMYHYGLGVAKNYKTAFEWYQKAAKQGGSDAETMLKKLKKDKGGCFVATVCYGNYDAPEVLILRAYRDEVLLKSISGTAFVKFYYFVSPPLAKQIEKSGKYWLSPIIRKINLESKQGRDVKQKYYE
jgi:TPR repeat protein